LLLFFNKYCTGLVRFIAGLIHCRSIHRSDSASQIRRKTNISKFHFYNCTNPIQSKFLAVMVLQLIDTQRRDPAMNQLYDELNHNQSTFDKPSLRWMNLRRIVSHPYYILGCSTRKMKFEFHGDVYGFKLSKIQIFNRRFFLQKVFFVIMAVYKPPYCMEKKIWMRKEKANMGKVTKMKRK
jgi:hypothetical protein